MLGRQLEQVGGGDASKKRFCFLNQNKQTNKKKDLVCSFLLDSNAEVILGDQGLPCDFVKKRPNECQQQLTSGFLAI